MFTKMLYVVFAVLMSLAGTVGAQVMPNTSAMGARTGSEIVAPTQKEVVLPDGSLQQPASKDSAESAANEWIATKKAAAVALLEKDVIKMTAHIIDFGGNYMTLDVEAYPKRGTIQTFKSGSYCLVGSLPAKFSITQHGEIAMERLPRFHGCTHNYILLDPITKEVQVYVYDQLSQGGKRRAGVRWTLNE